MSISKTNMVTHHFIEQLITMIHLYQEFYFKMELIQTLEVKQTETKLTSLGKKVELKYLVN